MQVLDFTTKVAILTDLSSTVKNLERPSCSSDSGSYDHSAFGFQFWVNALRSSSASGDVLEVYVAAEPEQFCADYQLLTDYHLTLLSEEQTSSDQDEGTPSRPCAGISVKFEPITKGYSVRSESERWTIRSRWDDALDMRCVVESGENESSYTCTVRLQLRVRDLLTAHREDYGEESLPRRDFSLIFGHQKQLYVDLQYLADQGSEYFQGLLESKRKGVRRAVVMNVDAPDMEIFLDAICTHRKPVITNRTFDTVLTVAQEFGVDKALRACEAYLIDTDAVHPIRKLEYAAEYGLGLLGERVVRQLTDARPMAALDTLHEYLQMNDETIDQMHPDVLYSLHIFDQYVVI